ncbi:MAG TPA: FAD-dependent oxidoreductase [Gaiellaceae bacterium]|nr:FAD-dependent oxidoreductase [Gaiellaceae bacterium]
MAFRVLIAGGGVAALEAALALRADASGLVDVEVLAPDTEFVYRPLATAAPFHAAESARLPLKMLVEEAGARLRAGRLAAVDADPHRITTDDGETIEYDALLLALGAVPRPAIPGAITFAGPGDERALAALLDAALTGTVERLVFALPSGVGWPLPVYELALLTAGYLDDAGATRAEVAVVTPEDAPLGAFGAQASDAVAEVLQLRGVELLVGTVPLSFADGSLRVAPDGDGIPADAVVALPRLEGPRVAGVAADAEGFVPVDQYGEVIGLDDVWAAGDLTTFKVKQGGVATQQADAAATSIAARAGADVQPAPFRPELRGLLLTGLVPRYLQGGEPGRSAADTEPLWWPPTKIVGRHLSPFLAQHIGLMA